MSVSELLFLNCYVGNYYICEQMLLRLWPLLHLRPKDMYICDQLLHLWLQQRVFPYKKHELN